MTSLRTVYYTIRSGKIPEAFDGYRMAVLADLHNCRIGRNGAFLPEAIRTEHPDLILLAGDIVTDEKSSRHRVFRGNAGKFLREIAQIAPVLYGLGNHEKRWQERTRNFPEGADSFAVWAKKIGDMGIRILDNTSVDLNRRGQQIRVSGLSLPLESFRRSKRRKADAALLQQQIGMPAEETFQILLGHTPADFAAYREWGAELSLAGHYHGGVVRLPVIGGVIATNFRLFPKYDRGAYTEQGRTMIVTSGLGVHTIPVRLFNPPELVIITLASAPEGEPVSAEETEVRRRAETYR